MRPARKARGGRIPGVCNRRATPRPGMQRRPNVTGLRRRDTGGSDESPGVRVTERVPFARQAVIFGDRARRRRPRIDGSSLFGTQRTSSVAVTSAPRLTSVGVAPGLPAPLKVGTARSGRRSAAASAAP